jgi:hypothetical protein
MPRLVRGVPGFPFASISNREALLRVSIPELVGDVPEAVMGRLMALPRWHGTKRKRDAPKSLHRESSQGAGVSARPLGADRAVCSEKAA